MVQTYPGAVWWYRGATTESTVSAGTVCYDVSSAERIYLTKLVVNFDASAAGKWWMFQGTTATAFLGPFYPATIQSWVFDFGPVGFVTTANGLDLGWRASTSGMLYIQALGYAR